MLAGLVAAEVLAAQAEALAVATMGPPLLEVFQQSFRHQAEYL
jgi:hypothetical protein